MRIFISGTSFDTRYGGPAVSVASHAVELAKAGARVTVWAPDGSAPANPMLSGQLGLDPVGGRLREIWPLAGQADVIHDNGIWMPHNHAIAVAAARDGLPRLVSVRGMLEAWAFNFRRGKKRLAWHLYQRRDLSRAACLHATSEKEAATLASYALGAPIAVIPNGIDISAGPKPRAVRKPATRTALFLGRIHPIKALPLLIEAWARVRPKAWTLRIVGPDEFGHTSELRGLVSSLGLDGAVSFEPLVSRAESANILAASDLLVLCSHSENFGMSVVEALSQEVPVLASRGTPWRSVAESGCGWWVETSVDGIAQGLRDATSIGAEERHEMGRRGRDLVSRCFSSAGVANQFLALYESLAAGQPAPTDLVKEAQ